MTITSPNGDKQSEGCVTIIGGGGLASFLENFGGKDHIVPKLALYRLWLGNEVDDMKCLTEAQGDGTWGQLDDNYFLAEGGSNELELLFNRLKQQYGTPIFGQAGQKLKPISNKSVPAELISQMRDLLERARV